MVFFLLPGGSVLVDVGHWPGSLAAPGWVWGKLGDLGFWGCSASLPGL